MQVRRLDERNLEIQAVAYGGSILLHLSDRRKLLIETALSGDVILTVVFGDSFRGIPVFDGEGDEITTLVPT